MKNIKESGEDKLLFKLLGYMVCTSKIECTRKKIPVLFDCLILLFYHYTFNVKLILNHPFYFFTAEAERIRKYKGRVFALKDEPEVARVWLPNSNAPGLAMARAFGDFCLKDFGLISVPEISYWHLSEKDEFIILATDGVMKPTCLILIQNQNKNGI